MSENKGCSKNIFSDAKKFIISVKKRGCPKTKGVRKHGVITVCWKTLTTIFPFLFTQKQRLTSHCLLLLVINLSSEWRHTFIVNTGYYVVHIVREETPVVENGGQHRSCCHGSHVLVVFMAIHLKSSHGNNFLLNKLKFAM